MNKKVHPIFSKKLFSHIISSSLLEFGPVLVFIGSFKFLRIYESTMLLMVATIISTIVTYRVQKRIPYLALYVAFMTILFGFMTIHSHKVKFIQMRDSLYDLTCALTLLIGLRFNVTFLELAFDKVLPMTQEAWKKLTYMWAGYFLVVALSNEVIRRMFTLETWFIFKGSIVILTSVLGFLSLYITYEAKHHKNS
jgi:intracellular septation protein